MTSFSQKWIHRLPDLGRVMKRFPVAAVIMACVTLYVILAGVDRIRDQMALALIGLTLAAYLAAMQTLWAEARERKPNWILQILTALALGVLFYHAKALHLNIVMLIGAVLLLLGNSVRFGRARDDLHIWDFTHKIWTAAGFAIAGSVIYLLGVMAIMAALKSLFGVNIEQLIEHLILPIGLVFLAQLYWLSNVPPVDESYAYLKDDPSFVSKAMAFLGTWILSPLTLIYALILLAYAVKILLQMELPKGEIAQLTVPFLLIGTLTWLLLEPPFIQKTMLARLFRKVWFALSVPAAVMLSIAVFVRVAEYGLTTERIMLIVACLWSLGLAAWFIRAPAARRDIRIIPALAAGLLLAAAPSAHYLSHASQAARLKTVLAQMKTVQTEDLKQTAATKGALFYLWRHDGEKTARNIIRGAGYDVPENASLEDIYDTLDLTNVKAPSRYDENSQVIRTIRYEFDAAYNSIAVKGYDYIAGDFYYSFSNDSDDTILNLQDVAIEMQKGTLIILEAGKEIGRFDLDDWVKSLPLENEAILVTDKQHVIYQDTERELTVLVTSINRDVNNDNRDVLSGNIRFYILNKGFKASPP